jgi:signal transduction histidine kinase
MPASRFNIRLKLILLLSLLVLSIIFISTFVSYFRDSQNLQAEIQKYGMVVTETFTQMAATHIFEMDYVTVLENAERLIDSSDVQSVTIIDVNGRVWISTQETVMNPLAINPFWEDTAGKEQLNFRKIQKDGQGILEFVNPITILGKVSHLVIIELSLKSMQTQLSERMQNILVLSFVLTSIAVLLAIVFSKLLTDPIKKLVSGTNEISQGNWDYRIEEGPRDEIGELSKSFNLMADNLQAELSERKRAQEALQNHRDQLEGLVKERTAKLENANRGMAQEIKDRKQAQKALRESEEKLARAEKMNALGLLAGGVAHDLNNVLSGIVSYPDILLRDLPEDSKYRKPIATMQASGLRAAAIVQDLLTVARGAATAKMPLQLNDILKEYLDSPELKKLEMYNPTVSIHTEIDPELFNIIGSSVHIRKVLMNLVSNAAEAIEGRGHVSIATMNCSLDRPIRGYDDVAIGDYAVLTVADDGPGISSADLQRIFEPFYTKKIMGRSGTGLGLAVVWNVVQDHKGYIDVITGEHGTIFKLYFPITRQKRAKDRQSINIDECTGDGQTILVVDDVDSQREISCEMLEILGYRTQAATSGEDAVDYLKNHSVDLILLDMIMDPGINGRETYERIIKIHPNQKAVIFSGFAETDEVKAAQQLGAGQFLKKPVTLEKLATAVKEELSK